MDTDWQCIERIRQGDASAFDEIFQRHKSLVLNLAYRFVQDRMVAEDIVQDVFIKVHAGKARADAAAKFSTWLYRVTVNASLDCIRRRKFFPLLWSRGQDREKGEGPSREESVASEAVPPSDALAAEEAREILRRAIHRLPEKLRAPLLLYHWGEMPYAQVAAILQISEKAVERRLCKARGILRKKLGGLGSLAR